jgi:RNA polymerase sigma factor (sigma-70 family)
MSETELLQAFRENRSEEAFAQLVHRYAGLVYSTAKRRLGNAALAEDITQIVFIRFANKPPRLRNQAELAAWLHRTTINVTVDLWRSETRRRNREQQAVVMEPATPENAVWEDISPKLDEALNQLNDEDRQALLLRFFGQKAMREVGAALGVSEDAAKMRVSRAVDRLRTQLGVGAAACTAAMLSTMLTEYSVEAAPSQFVARLAAMKLPVAAGVAVGGGWFAAFLKISKLQLAAGMAVLTVVGIGTVHLLRSLDAPLPGAAVTNPQTHPVGTTTGMANRERFDSSGFNPSAAPPSRQMLFHVADAETGDGLANTRIRAAFFGAGGMGEGNDIVTDKNGDAVIPEPDDQVMNVFVVAEGHVPKVVMFHGEGIPAEYTIKLDPAMTAGGVVVDEQGLPVAGVTILIQNPGAKLDRAENVDFQTCPVSSRDDGSWSCSYLPFDYTNEIRFILKKDGFATTYPVVPVAKVGLNNLVLMLNRGFTVVGRIADVQNQPVANARIRIVTNEAGKQQSARTDKNGVFTLAGVAGDTEFSHEPALPAGDNGVFTIRGLVGQGLPHVDLAVQADGFAPQSRMVALPDTTNVAEFTLSPGNIFRGQVVDEAGHPIANAIVQTDWDNQGIRAFDWQTRTDASGRFEWDSAPKRPVLFWFEADGYQWQRGVSLVADGSDHEITLKSKVLK